MPTLKISGMRCQHCSTSVAKALAEIDGLQDISVDLEKNEARYTETTPVPIATIVEAITRIGFDVV